ncbi:MAG: serine/threonine-protein phosphatase, partial [Hyphomicrobiaceae bacterium]|nr:serine/threonine-protein phosphatase [Hyphomicrobiaceae bacterium]
MQPKIHAAVHSIQGSRSYQEDSSAIWRAPGDYDDESQRPILAVVSDGMGGHVSGEVASRIACETFVSTFANSNGRIPDRLRLSLDTCNQAIKAAIAEKPEFAGMGCTLVAAYIDDSGLWHVSVGDSLLLMLRTRVLHRLNDNHSFGAVLDQQAEAGLISHEDALNNPRRNSLRSALTGDKIALVDLPSEPSRIEKNDWLILASDGLDTLNGHEIADVVVEHDGSSPEAITKALLTSVEAHGLPNQDNTTVLALRIVDG